MKFYSIMFMESLRFYVFYLVCYYFTKKAVRLLTITGDQVVIGAGDA